MAEDATIVSRDVPLGGERTLASTPAPARFNLVGLHWRGPGSVQFRTRSLAGRWSAWEAAAPEAEDQPDAGTAERARYGAWRLGNPWWVGPSDRIEYRLRGKVTKLRAFFVWSPTAGVPARTLQQAGAPADRPAERLERGREDQARGTRPIAPALRLALVHHTAGANGYTAAQSPAIVRAIELYHVQGNGWNDIGYNFLVDRFGQVFEGRYGGIERNVVGAHAEGFNTGSVGVAVLGEYGSLPVAQKARDALAALLAWRLDIAHVDPASTLSFISGGNARFPAGLPVFLRTVSGHRDTGFTDCPGNGALRPSQRPRGRRRPASACRSCMRRSSPAPCRASSASGRGCRRLCRGRSTSTTPPARSRLVRRLRAERGLDAGMRLRSLPAGTPTRSRSDDVTPAIGTIGGQRRRDRALDRRPRDRPGDGLAERRRCRGRDDDHLHADAAPPT